MTEIVLLTRPEGSRVPIGKVGTVLVPDVPGPYLLRVENRPAEFDRFLSLVEERVVISAEDDAAACFVAANVDALSELADKIARKNAGKTISRLSMAEIAEDLQEALGRDVAKVSVRYEQVPRYRR